MKKQNHEDMIDFIGEEKTDYKKRGRKQKKTGRKRIIE